MTPRAVSARWLLVVLGLSLAAPVLGVDGCDEACGSHCGDCAACPLTAELDGGTEPERLEPTALWVGPHHAAPARHPRGVDHVPLSQAIDPVRRVESPRAIS